MQTTVALWLVGLLLAVIGSVVSLGISLLLRTLASQGRAQQENQRMLAEMRVTLLGQDGVGGLVSRVNLLHDWKNELQRRELDAALAENRRLKDRIEEAAS